MNTVLTSLLPANQCRPQAIRVALVIYRDSAGSGGAYRVAGTLSANLRQFGIEPHLVVAYGNPGPIAESGDCECYYLCARGPKDLRAWRRARELFRKLRPDLIHFVEPVVWLNLALLGARHRRIWYAHGRFLPEYMRWRDRKLMHLVARLNEGCVCITEGARQSMIELGLGTRDRLWTVYNAVDVSRFQMLPSRVEARRQLGVPTDVRLLAMVGRLTFYKGGWDALNVLTRLDDDWRLMFVGEGPYRGELETLVRQRCLGDRVHFTGPLADVRPAYAAMDVFLFLTRYEPFGLVLAEAMAAGVPVFGLGALGEYREKSCPLVLPDNAVFVERHNPQDQECAEAPAVLDELAARIREFAQHPKEFEPMVNRARMWVKEHFDAPVQARAMAKLYSMICGKTSAPAARKVHAAS